MFRFTSRRRSLLFAAVAATVGASPVRGATMAHWLNAVSGNWTDGTKWSTSPNFPTNGTPAGATYDAIIAAAGSPYTVNLNSTITVDSLALNHASATLLHSVSALTAPMISVQSGTFRVDGGSVVNATIHTGSTGVFDHQTGALSNVTLASDVTLRRTLITNGFTLANANVSSQRYASGSGGLTFSGTQTLGGTGTISFDGTYNLYPSEAWAPLRVASGGTLTIGPNVTVQTGTTSGFIGGDWTSATSADTWINQGTLWSRSADQALRLRGNWRNDGILKVTAGTLFLGGSFRTADMGTIERSGDGALILSGLIDNNGSALEPTAATGPITVAYDSAAGIRPPTVTGGVVRAAAANPLTIDHATLDHVTVEGDGVTVRGGHFVAPTIAADAMLKVTGTMWVEPATPGGVAVINGGGDIVIAGGFVRSSATLEVGPAVTVTGSGTIGSYSDFTNRGTIRTSGGDAIRVGDYGTAYPWRNFGVLDATEGGTILLFGTATAADLGDFRVGDGAVVFAGTMNNTGNTLLLDGPAKSLSLAGQVSAGTVTTINGAQLRVPPGELARLPGVAVDADIHVERTGRLRFDNASALVNGGIVRMRDQARFEINTLLSGNGEVLFEAPGSSTLEYNDNAVIDSGITLRTNGGSGGIGFSSAIDHPIINRGLISAESEGTTIGIPNTLMNEGTLSVSAGTMQFTAPLKNSGTVNVTGGTLDLAAPLENTGTLSLSGGQLNLGGSDVNLSTLGTFIRTGGTVALTGVYNNTGSTTADLNNAVGPWVAGGFGRINGGSIVPPALGLPLEVLAAGSLTVDGASIDTDVFLHPAATLKLAGSWQNNGTITGNAATVDFGGTFATSVIGSIALTNSTINYSGIINNAGAILPVPTNASGNTVILKQGGKITGGTVGEAGQLLLWTGGTFDGVILAADVLMTDALGQVTNGLTLEGGATIEIRSGPSAPATAEFRGTQVLGGSGEVLLTGAGASTLSTRLGTLTIGNGVTIRTGSDSLNPRIGTFGTSLINQGLISMQTAGRTLELARINNQGTVEVSNGGTVVTSQNVFTNSGTVSVGGGSMFRSPVAVTWSGGIMGGEGSIEFISTANIVGDVAKPGTGALRVAGTFTLAADRKLDLTKGKLILAQMSAGTFSDGSYNGVQGLVQSGRSGGSWDGAGIVTSISDALEGVTSLAVAAASETSHAGGTFGAFTIAPSDALVMYTYAGDANLDGKINIDDYGRIDGNVSQSGSVFGWSNGDFNYDGKINIDDYGIIDGNINRQGEPFSAASAAAGVTAVPEPSLAGLALLGLLARRRRRC